VLLFDFADAKMFLPIPSISDSQGTKGTGGNVLILEEAAR
jgi:hypothetical protein